MRLLSLNILIFTTVGASISAKSSSNPSMSYRLLPRGFSTKPPLAPVPPKPGSKRRAGSFEQIQTKRARVDSSSTGSLDAGLAANSQSLPAQGPSPEARAPAIEEDPAKRTRSDIPVIGTSRSSRPNQSSRPKDVASLQDSPKQLPRDQDGKAKKDTIRDGSTGPTKSTVLVRAEEKARKAREKNRILRPNDTSFGSPSQLVTSFRKDQAESRNVANAYKQAAEAAKAAGRPDREQRNRLKFEAANAESRLSEAYAEQAAKLNHQPDVLIRAREKVRERQREYESFRRNGGKDTDSTSGTTPSASFSSLSESSELSGSSRSVESPHRRPEKAR